LSSQDRWGIQNDMFALVKANHIDSKEYVRFLENFADENEFLPLTSIASNLYQAFIVLKESKRDEIKKFGAEFFEKILLRIGFDPSSQEPVTTSILRTRYSGMHMFMVVDKLMPLAVIGFYDF
jgi:hypothetical protein